MLSFGFKAASRDTMVVIGFVFSRRRRCRNYGAGEGNTEGVAINESAMDEHKGISGSGGRGELDEAHGAVIGLEVLGRNNGSMLGEELADGLLCGGLCEIANVQGGAGGVHVLHTGNSTSVSVQF